jgi:Glycosyl hydrolases family 43
MNTRLAKWGMTFFLFLRVCLTQGQLTTAPVIRGEPFRDTDGQPINAHGAGLLFYQGQYYLFGEIKTGRTWLVPGQQWEDYRVPAGGVSCYCSDDCHHWKYKGIALAPFTGDPSSDLDTGKVIERPKVLYNKKTKKFVMWMHIDRNDYSYSHAGVALSDRPEGPYHYIKSIQPNGNMARDMTLFEDDDGLAYLVYSSEHNKTMHICRLSDDYLHPSAADRRILINQNREAPAMFKHGHSYYLISSACTGWSPNPASYAVADHPFGPWINKGNPCSGPGADSCFLAQSTYVLPIEGKPDDYIFMADRWNKLDLPDSRYVWLPLTVRAGKVLINWVENP